MMEWYADEKDIEVCRKIHKEYGTTYYYATQCFPAKYRRRVHSIYAFVRVPDEWVDNPGDLSVDERRRLLNNWRGQMVRGLAGERPEHPAMRAFCDTARECRLPIDEAHTFLDAMEMDLDQTSYQTFEDLRGYMRGSASAVGVLMCHAMCARTDYDTIARAKALGEAMQLTNFLRDIREDLVDRGRVYLPQEDLDRFGVTVEDLRSGEVTERFRALMQFEIDRARELYRTSDFGIYKLPKRMRRAVLLSRLLYSEILGRIEANQYDVFRVRARTNKVQKLAWLAKVMLSDERILVRLVSDSGISLRRGPA
ncbi:MAG: phytoene/squalene synthase family protein [Armatimonadetes bacterium]|nr:phytoene/squalene synthase family protein [Armatimonadota bacterium]